MKPLSPWELRVPGKQKKNSPNLSVKFILSQRIQMNSVTKNVVDTVCEAFQLPK